MTNVNIPALASFVAIDGAADLIELYDTSLATNVKTSRNQFLNITSVPLGLTDTQSPTNKTFDNTNTITVKATLFTLQDNTDTTKQARFVLSGITSGQTRSYTLPNASGTLVDLASSQTLTSKTLTSPTINTPTINNPTLNTDAISEFTASNGVTVAGMNVKSGKLNTNNSVVTANITDAAVTPAKLVAGTGSGWAWSTWAPTWTNLAVGNGTLVAKYIQIGKMIIGRMDLVFGTTTTVTGSVAFTWPVTAVSYGGTGNLVPVGSAFIYDTSASRAFKASVLMTSTTTGTLYAETADATYVYATALSGTIPFAAAYAVGDELGMAFEIEGA